MHGHSCGTCTRVHVLKTHSITSHLLPLGWQWFRHGEEGQSKIDKTVLERLNLLVTHSNLREAAIEVESHDALVTK